MRYIISFSGGISSAVSALVAHKNGLPFEMVFADTTIEDEDLYRFNADVAKAVGQPIIHLQDGRDPWSVFVSHRYIGNTRTAHCSTDLKTLQVQAWMADNCSLGDPLVLGMDMGELDRLERAATRWAPRPVVSLLRDFKVHRPDYGGWLSEYGLSPPRLYAMGFPHNNCGGMCVKAGLAQFATLLRNFPDRYAHHEDRQEWAMLSIGPTARPFLRHTVSKVVHYLTLREFREKYLAGEIKVDPFDFGGCGCFSEF